MPTVVGPKSWLDDVSADRGLAAFEPLAADAEQQRQQTLTNAQQPAVPPPAPHASFSDSLPSFSDFMGQVGAGAQQATAPVANLLSSLPSSFDEFMGRSPSAAPAPSSADTSVTTGASPRPVAASGTPQAMPTNSSEQPPAGTAPAGAIDNSSRESFIRTAYPHALQAAGGDKKLANQMVATAISENGAVGTGKDLGQAMGWNMAGIHGQGPAGSFQATDAGRPTQFAAFPDAATGMGGFLWFLHQNPRYAPALAAYDQNHDVDQLMRGVAAQGYAEDPIWGENQIAIRKGQVEPITAGLSATPAAPAARPVAASGAPVALPSNAPSSTYTQQGLADAGDPDAWAKCGPVAAFQFAQRMGRNPTPAEVEQLARQAGWTGASGMAGLGSEAAVLKGMGIAAHATRAVDWNAVIADVQRGNPVILELPGHEGHYVTAQGYDPATGKIDFGSTVGDLRAANHQTAFTPAEFPSLGWGSPSGALFLDNPATPAPSVVAGQSAPPNPAVSSRAAGPAPADAIPSASAGASDQTLTSPDAPASAAPAYSAPAGRGGGGGVMSLQRPKPAGLPADSREQDQGPHEWRPEYGDANYPADDAGRAFPGAPAVGSWPGDDQNPNVSDNGQGAPAPYVPDRTDPTLQPRAVPNSPYAAPGRAYGVADDAMYRQPLGAPTQGDTTTGDQQPQSTYNDPTDQGTISQPLPPQQPDVAIGSGTAPNDQTDWHVTPTAPPPTPQQQPQAAPSGFPGLQAVYDSAGNFLHWIQGQAHGVQNQVDSQVAGPVQSTPGEPDYAPPYNPVQKGINDIANEGIATPIGRGLATGINTALGRPTRPGSGGPETSIDTAITQTARSLPANIAAAQQGYQQGNWWQAGAGALGAIGDLAPTTTLARQLNEMLPKADTPVGEVGAGDVVMGAALLHGGVNAIRATPAIVRGAAALGYGALQEGGRVAGKIAQAISEGVPAEQFSQWLNRAANTIDQGIGAARGAGRPLADGAQAAERVPAPGEQLLGSGVVPQQSGEAAPPFYSQLQRTIEEKMPNRATPQQVQGILRGSPVKPDEIAWTGFDDWLREQKGPVTKQQALDFLDQNAVQVQEVVKGGGVDRSVVHDTEQALLGGLGNRRWNPAEADRLRLAVQREGTSAYTGNDPEIKLLVQEYADAHASAAATPPTKFGNYTLPGGTNYRELLLTLPDRGGPARSVVPNGALWDVVDDSGNHIATYAMRQGAEIAAAGKLRSGIYQSAHWDEPNVLAHVRFNDRVAADGKKVLNIEEVQSDWHQAGRKQGYAADDADIEQRMNAARAEQSRIWQETSGIGRDPTPEQSARLEALRRESEQLYAEMGRARSGVPNAPFTKTWPELAVKRMIRYAAENGYERITWPPGQVHADRYSLERHIGELTWERDPAHWSKPEPTWTLTAKRPDGGLAFSENNVGAERMGGLIGQELAQRITSAPESSGQMTGMDLRTGGEGMKGFYDQILPSVAQKIGKKFGARVTTSEIPTTTRYWAAPQADGTWAIRDDTMTRMQQFPSFATEAEADRFAQTASKTQTVHSMDITPSMRESVMQQGQQLFSGAGIRNAPGLRASAFNAAQGGVLGAYAGDQQDQAEGGTPNYGRRLAYGLAGAGLAVAAGSPAARGVAGRLLGSGFVSRGPNLEARLAGARSALDEIGPRLEQARIAAEGAGSGPEATAANRAYSLVRREYDTVAATAQNLQQALRDTSRGMDASGYGQPLADLGEQASVQARDLRGGAIPRTVDDTPRTASLGSGVVPDNGSSMRPRYAYADPNATNRAGQGLVKVGEDRVVKAEVDAQREVITANADHLGAVRERSRAEAIAARHPDDQEAQRTLMDAVGHEERSKDRLDAAREWQQAVKSGNTQTFLGSGVVPQESGRYDPRLAQEPVLPGMEPPNRAPGDAGPPISDAPNRPRVLGDIPPSQVREPTLPGMQPPGRPYEQVGPLGQSDVPNAAPTVESALGNVPPSQVRQPVLPGTEEPSAPRLAEYAERFLGPAPAAGESLVSPPNRAGRLFDTSGLIDPLLNDTRPANPSPLPAENLPPRALNWYQQRAAANAARMQARGIQPVSPLQWVRNLTASIGYSSMIGPGTFSVSLASNALEPFYAIPRELGRGVVRAAQTGRMEALREPGAMAAGALTGMGRVSQALWDVIREKGAYAANLDMAPLSERTADPIGRLLAQALEVPGRVWSGVPDAIFGTIAEHAGRAREAAQTATDAGMQGDAWKQHVQALLADAEAVKMGGQLPSMAATQAVLDAGHQYANRMSYRDPLGSVGRQVKTATRMGNIPVVSNLIAPFFNTPWNMLLRQAERSPAGLVMNTQKRYDKVYDAFVGSAMTVGLAGAASLGYVTGSGPSDPGQKKLLEADGWKPYSTLVSLPGQQPMYVPNRLFGIAETLLNAAGDAHDYSTYRKPTDDLNTLTPDALARIGSLVGQQPFAAGYTSIANLVQYGPESFAADQATRMTPFASTARLIGTAQDTMQRRPDTGAAVTPQQDFAGRYAAGVGNRAGLPVVQDILGHPQANNQQGAWALLPPFSPQTQSPVADAYRGANMTISMPPADISGVALSAAQQRQYQQIMGQTLEQIATDVVSDPGWKDIPLVAQKKILSSFHDAASKVAEASVKGDSPDFGQRFGDAVVRKAQGLLPIPYRQQQAVAP